MNVYDIVMIVVFAGATLFGAWKGMAWQIASLSSLVLSYVVALRFSDQLAPHLPQQAPWNRFLAMLILYMATSMVIWLLFRIVAGLIDKIRLKEFDRQIGALFGAAKGLLLCIAITFFAVCLAPQFRPEILSSKSGLFIAQLIDKADAVMPPEVHDVLGPYLHRMGDELNPGGTMRHAETDKPERRV